MKKLFFALIALAAMISCSREQQPRPVIFDTDWWTDVDDALAIRILKAAQNDGIFEIKGICLSAVEPASAGSISAFLDYEGLGGIPIAADKDAVDFNGVPCYHDTLRVLHPQGAALTLDDCEDCVPFYRRILAASKRKVEIIVVGFPNTVSKLLESPADEISPLSGAELVEKKVAHLWMMAGKYPEGGEHNFNNAPRSQAAAYKVCECWPTPITFLGFEIGIGVKAGSTLPKDDLLSQILLIHGDLCGRYAWDPMTVEMAAMGTPEAAGYEAVRGRTIVDPENGYNTFEENPEGRHCYVKMLHEPAFYAARLDSILVANRP